MTDWADGLSSSSLGESVPERMFSKVQFCYKCMPKGGLEGEEEEEVLLR